MSRDERLARAAAAGDSDAFAAIFKRYKDDLYRFCLTIVGNPSDAQDALQGTMVKALKALPGERREVKLKPWLYRVARNESIDIVRARRETPAAEPEEHLVSESAAGSAESRARLRALLTDLSQLPERQRAALVMRELGGLEYEEIGASFESTAAVARQTVYEARIGLREMEEGREMSCDAVKRAISDADGRVLRRRDLRAHLRGCEDCRRFRDSIGRRQEDFVALAPLPAAASLAILQGALGASGTAAGGAGTGAATVGAGSLAGKALAAPALVKTAAAVAVLAAGVATADRAGLIDPHLPGAHNGSSSAPAQSGAGGPGSQAGGGGAGSGNGGAAGSAASAKHGAVGAAKPAGKASSGAGGATGGEASSPGAGEGASQQPDAAGGGSQSNGGQGKSKGHSKPHANSGGKGQGKSQAGHPSHPSHPEQAQTGKGNGAAAGGNASPAQPIHPAHPSTPEKSSEKVPDNQSTGALKPPKSETEQGGAAGERPQS